MAHLDDYIRKLKKSVDHADERVRRREKDVEVAKKRAFDAKVMVVTYRKIAEDIEETMRDNPFQSVYMSPEFRKNRLANLKRTVHHLEENATKREKAIERAIKSVEIAKVLAEECRKTLEYFKTVKF